MSASTVNGLKPSVCVWGGGGGGGTKTAFFFSVAPHSFKKTLALFVVVVLF